MPLARLRRGIGLGLLLLTLAACGGLAGEPAIVATLPVEPTAAAIQLLQFAPDLALGAEIFAANCTRCHGATGRGDGELVLSGQIPRMSDFTDAAAAHTATPLEWYEIVTNGRIEQLMPPWDDRLTTAERWAVTLYVYTLTQTREQLALGQNIWQGKCAACHGEAGEGVADGAPLPDMLAISTSGALDVLAQGIGDKMPAFEAELSETERAAVIAYARTLRLSNSPLETDRLAGAEATAVAPLATVEAEGEDAVLGVVSGAVTNHSAGGGVPAELAITLHIVGSPDAPAEQQTLNGTVDAAGRYRFEGVPFAAGWQYAVTTTYEHAFFNSEIMAGDPVNPQLELPLAIYEVTDDPANIQVTNMTMILRENADRDEVQVVQIVSFNNASDRVFLQLLNGAPASVSIRLPAGAVFQQFAGGSYLTLADGLEVWDTTRVLPGNAHVMHITYSLPVSQIANISQPMAYALDGQVEFLIDSGALSVSGDGLATLGNRQVGERAYASYGGTLRLAAGESLRYRVNGLAGESNSLGIVAAVLVGTGLLMIGVALGFFWRERKGTDRTPDIKGLVEQISELDQFYQNGTLTEAAYRKQRAVLKAQLAPLMKDKILAAVEAEPDDKP